MQVIIRMFIKIMLFFFLIFWTLHAAHGILVPQPGIELVLSAVEV